MWPPGDEATCLQRPLYPEVQSVLESYEETRQTQGMRPRLALRQIRASESGNGLVGHQTGKILAHNQPVYTTGYRNQRCLESVLMVVPNCGFSRDHQVNRWTFALWALTTTFKADSSRTDRNSRTAGWLPGEISARLSGNRLEICDRRHRPSSVKRSPRTGTYVEWGPEYTGYTKRGKGRRNA